MKGPLNAAAPIAHATVTQTQIATRTENSKAVCAPRRVADSRGVGAQREARVWECCVAERLPVPGVQAGAIDAERAEIPIASSAAGIRA